MSHVQEELIFIWKRILNFWNLLLFQFGVTTKCIKILHGMDWNCISVP